MPMRSSSPEPAPCRRRRFDPSQVVFFILGGHLSTSRTTIYTIQADFRSKNLGIFVAMQQPAARGIRMKTSLSTGIK